MTSITIRSALHSNFWTKQKRKLFLSYLTNQINPSLYVSGRTFWQTPWIPKPHFRVSTAPIISRPNAPIVVFVSPTRIFLSKLVLLCYRYFKDQYWLRIWLLNFQLRRYNCGQSIEIFVLNKKADKYHCMKFLNYTSMSRVHENGPAELLFSCFRLEKHGGYRVKTFCKNYVFVIYIYNILVKYLKQDNWGLNTL